MNIKSIVKLFFLKVNRVLFPNLEYNTSVMLKITSDLLVNKLLADPRYKDVKRLEPFGFKVYSQNDEDGIIQEIFNRIGVKSKTFIEFGVGSGLENNTTYLLMQGWNGLWIEANSCFVENLRKIYKNAIESKRLKIEKAFVDKSNINSLIKKYYQNEVDLLSIDIDGNDYYIWKEIECVNPRVVVVEYNGKFPPPFSWVMPYDDKHCYDGSDKMGMSLQAATDFANSINYQLVGTNLNGVNAFFVRKDLLNNDEGPIFSQESVECLYNRSRHYISFCSDPKAKYFLG